MAKLIVDDAKSGRYEPTCKTCNSEHRDWIETQLLKQGASLRAVCKLLKERYGETFYPQSLSKHRDAHMTAWRADDPIDETIKALEMDAAAAPSVVAAGYQVLIHNLRGLQSTTPNSRVMLDAVKTVANLTGMSAGQSVLRAYLEKAFSAEEPDELETVVVQQLDSPPLEIES